MSLNQAEEKKSSIEPSYIFNNDVARLANLLDTKVSLSLSLVNLTGSEAFEIISSLPLDYAKHVAVQHARLLKTVLFKDIEFSKSTEGKLLMKLPKYAQHNDKRITLSSADGKDIGALERDVEYLGCWNGCWSGDGGKTFAGGDLSYKFKVVRRLRDDAIDAVFVSVTQKSGDMEE